MKTAYLNLQKFTILSKFIELSLQKSLGDCGQQMLNTLQTLLSRNCTITDGVSKLKPTHNKI